MSLQPVSGTVVDDGQLAELARRIREGHASFKRTGEDAINHAIDVGEQLLEARTIVPRGEWVKWLEENCRVSVSTAYMYEKIAIGKEFVLAGIRVGEPIYSLRAAIRALDAGDGTRSGLSKSPEAIARGIANKKRAALERIEIDDAMIKRTADWFITQFPKTFAKLGARRSKHLSEMWAGAILNRIFLKDDSAQS